jgi:hypothetical protein
MDPGFACWNNPGFKKTSPSASKLSNNLETITFLSAIVV